MLSVILIWIYMIVTTFLLGYGILTGLSHFFPYQVRHPDSYLMCGLAAATVYAQFFSIFAPVGIAANLILTIVCLLIAVLCRKKIKVDFRKSIVFFILFFLFAYGASRGIIHYDTSLYHAQSIRWIEEYGAVKGLGNLHCRLAYNSASFALSALYSMSFLGGQSYHCAAGFFALIIACVCSGLGEAFRRKQLRASDFARIMGIYYLLVIFDEMISPASDYFMVLTAFYIIIRWMELLEEKEETVFPYAMLCVLGVYLMTVKLSAALILLLVIRPAYYLLRDKRWKETAGYLLLGIVTAAPFLIRNVLLSGWLVYPFTSIDIIRADWKIPKGIAAYDAREIQVWGRGYSDVLQYEKPIWEWLPEWFRGLGGTDRIFVLAAIVSVLVFCFRLVWKFAKKSFSEKFLGELLLEGVVCVCFLFWLLTSPLIRYGCVYVYLASAVVWGNMFTEFCHKESPESGRLKQAKRWMEQGALALIALFMVYKAFAFGKELSASYVDDYWVYQKDYENYETESYEIDGFVFYYPVTGDRTGYDDFPSSPARAHIGLRGDDIGDGFYYAE